MESDKEIVSDLYSVSLANSDLKRRPIHRGPRLVIHKKVQNTGARVATLSGIMAKRRRGLCSKENSESGDQHCSVDRISMLPDELLLSILSHLPFKEITAASIISRRWRYFWTFARALDVDGMTSLLRVGYTVRKRESKLNRERSNYVRCVNRIISLHKEPTIDELRLFFNLNKTYENSIDKWFRFALARKVQRLELNLTDDACTRSRRYHECYTFPYELLCNSSHSTNFKYLKKLSMNYVNVNGEAVEFILRICPLLEDLSISQSGELTDLKIIGPFSSFKRLEISLCHNLNSFEIRDVNLVYLNYKGSKIVHFVLENVPLLVNVFIGGMITGDMEHVFSLLSRYIPKLEILSVDILDIFHWKEPRLYIPAVKMIKLKQLVVKVCVIGDHSFMQLTNLLHVSPYLQLFVLKASHSGPEFVERKAEMVQGSYAHLKEIKFEGFCGVISDLELVMHFLKNATSLKKIVIDPRQPCLSTYHCAFKYGDKLKHGRTKEEMDARTRAMEQLTNKVPRNIILDIL
ncbi:F-box/FBD/LRR-repeat protein at5g53840 [Phtheirospermum japonicum]|uniref:F-box/FBD/LRR-repeat protein at5g53840 n=1 Tax=Phtheirospermum japonicum TaxID=374723 RepID=A0A830BPE2_9LAMI|nr:F-box/FBD/LRR-repeat protein at5g53840 [Phtheirospermum japonicum]